MTERLDALPRRPCLRRPVGLVFAPFLALLVPSPVAARAKTDVVVLDNGDHVTGEIKGMSRGKLDLSTDDAGRLSIEWLKVARVTSVHTYEVELTSGVKHYGQLLELPAGGKGVVDLGSGSLLPVEVIVAITPLDAGLWSRLQAYLDFGFTLAKSNKATTLNTAGEVAYRGEQVGTTLDFTAYVQDDANIVTVGSYGLHLSGDYYLTRWRAVLLAGLDRNDELALQLRISMGSGAAYTFLQNNSMRLLAGAGLVTTREQYASSPAAWNLDAYFNGTWEAFRYDSPKLDLSVSLTLFPGLTDWGRVRGDFAFRVKYELFSDFNVGLTFTDSFDTRPPDPAASKNDYIASFTIGWTYRR